MRKTIKLSASPMLFNNPFASKKVAKQGTIIGEILVPYYQKGCLFEGFAMRITPAKKVTENEAAASLQFVENTPTVEEKTVAVDLPLTGLPIGLSRSTHSSKVDASKLEVPATLAKFLNENKTRIYGSRIKDYQDIKYILRIDAEIAEDLMQYYYVLLPDDKISATTKIKLNSLSVVKISVAKMSPTPLPPFVGVAFIKSRQ